MIDLNNFRRPLTAARPFESNALRDADVLAWATLPEARNGQVVAHYLEAGAHDDPSKLAVAFGLGRWLEITIPLIAGVYAFAGGVFREGLNKVEVTDRVTAGFFELDVLYEDETFFTLVFDPDIPAYVPVGLVDMATSRYKAKPGT